MEQVEFKRFAHYSQAQHSMYVIIEMLDAYVDVCMYAHVVGNMLILFKKRFTDTKVRIFGNFSLITAKK